MKGKWLNGIVMSAGILFSPMSRAVSEVIRAQSDDVLNIVTYAVSTILAMFLVFLIIQKIRLNRAHRMASQASQLSDSRQALLDVSGAGLMHLDRDGKVLWANTACTTLLRNSFANFRGQRPDHVMNLSNDHALSVAIEQHKTCQFNLALPGDIYLAVHFSAQQTDIDGVASVLAIADVSLLQRLSNSQQDQISILERLVEDAEQAFTIINEQDETLLLNPAAAKLLLIPEDIKSCSLSDWQKRIFSLDFQLWQQGYQRAQNGQTTELRLRLGESAALTSIKMVLTPVADGRVAVLIQPLADLVEAEQSAENEKNKFNGLLQAQPYPCYLADKDGILLACNSAFELLFGVNQTALMGENVDDLAFLPETFMLNPQQDNLMVMSMAGGLSQEATVKTALRENAHVRFISKAFQNYEGKVAGYIGQFEDMTELRQMQQQAQEAQTRFKSIIDSAPSGILMLDDEEQIAQSNKTFIELSQLSPEKLKKTSIYELFTDSVSAGKAAKLLSRQGFLYDFSTELKLAENKIVPCRLHVQRFGDSGLPYICWISDISGEHFAKQQLDSVVGQSAIAMAMVNERGFTFLNDAAMDLFGFDSEQEWQEKSPYSMELNVDANQASKMTEMFAELETTGKVVRSQWVHVRHGQELPCEVTLVPMFHGEELQSTLCIWQDLSDIHQAKEARLEAVNLQQAAEKQLADKQQLLEKSQHQLADKLAALNEAESTQAQLQGQLSDAQKESEELKLTQVELQAELEQAQLTVKHTMAELKDSQQQRGQLQQELQDRAHKVMALEKQRTEIADAMQRSEQKLQRAQAELQQAEVQINGLQQTKLQGEQQLAELKSQLNTQQQASLENQSQLQQANEQITTLQFKLNSATQSSDELKTQLQNLRRASEQAANEKRGIEKAFQEAQDALNHRQLEYDSLQSTLSDIEKLAAEREEELLANNSEWQEQKRSFSAQQDQLNERLLEAQKRLQQAEDAHQDKQQEIEQISAEAEKTRQKLIESEARAAKLLEQRTEQIESLQQQLKSAAEKAQMEKQEKESTAKHFAEQQQELEEKLKQASENLEHARVEHQRAQKNASEVKEDARQSKQRLQQTEQKAATLLAQRTEQIKALQQAMLALKSEAEKERQDKAEVQQAWQQEQQQLQQALQQARHDLEHAQQDHQQAQQRIEEVQDDANHAQHQLHDKEQQAAELLAERSAEIDSLKRAMQEIQKQAEQQRLAMAGSDQQWQQQHADLQEQKQTLQEALQQSDEQRRQTESALKEQEKALENAAQQAAAAAKEESVLAEQLKSQQQQSQQLQEALQQTQQEQQALAQQIEQQEQEIQTRESKIAELQLGREDLEKQLQQLREQYDSSQENLSEQGQSQAALSDELAQLQGQLKQSQTALSEKESQLNNAQQQLNQLNEQLDEKEKALQTVEKQGQSNDSGPTPPPTQDAESPRQEEPEFAKLPMPDSPTDWFDLLPYLQKHPSTDTVPVLLQGLLSRMQELYVVLDAAVAEEKLGEVLRQTRRLQHVAADIDSAPLQDMSAQIEEACRRKDFDSVDIFWPNVKRSIMTTLRVIYSQVHA